MILVDKALHRRQEEGRPIRAALIGAGFIGRGIALQILSAVPGIRLSVIASRRAEAGLRAYAEAGIQDARVVRHLAALEDCIAAGRYAVVEDGLLAAQAARLDAIIEATGSVEFGSHVVLHAIRHAKHVILMNAELDGTLGPILKVYADRAGVIISNSDGDQPGVLMNLYRFVKGIGVRPVLCGNIKGLQDRYRTPSTQEAFAHRWGQQPHMVTSFADGTKISFEQAVVANATGMRVARRGMLGPSVPPGTPLQQAVRQFPEELLLKSGGIVDYVVGAEPAPGVFVLGTQDHPVQKHFLNLYKMGEGPIYCFHTPYHLCHFELPFSIVRAVDFADAVITPLGAPQVDVVATAKTDLKKGDIIDGIGGFCLYGQCENSEVVRRRRLLPMGLSENCRLKRDVGKDQVLTFEDVLLPEDRLSDRLWEDQNRHFFENFSPHKEPR